MSFRTHVQNLTRPLIEYRILLSLGMSMACGILLNTLYPINSANPLLRLVAWERPPIFHSLVWSYDLFLYSTPFLAFSMLFSLAYVHIYRRESEQVAGALPPYPDPRTRSDLSLVLGELHRQLVPKPSPAPQWLTIPERGLYTGTCIVGATGSGKTTLLNVLADAIPEEERILIIEDTAELHLRKPHVVAEEAQTDTHRKTITFDDLLKAALRHRPDRIILGEIRGTEARTLLDAMNTGHRGALATIHASSAKGALLRLRNLLMRGTSSLLPAEAEAEIRSSIHRIVHIDREHGERRIKTILDLAVESDPDHAAE